MLLGRMLGTSLGSFGASPPPTPGSCSADGQFIWDIGGFWRRRNATDVCQGVSSDTVTTNIHSSSGESTLPTDTLAPPPTIVEHGPITVVYNMPDDDASSTAPGAAGQSLQVGPFLIPMGARQYTIKWEGLLPDDWRTFIAQELAHDCSNCIRTSLQDASPGHVMGRLLPFFGSDLPAKVNQDLVAFWSVPVDQNPPRVEVSLPDQPVAVVTRPDTGEEWGMFMVILPRDPTYPWDSTTNPYVLNLFWRKKPQGVWDWIKRIVGDIVNAVEKVLCSVMPAASTVPNPYVQAGAVALKLSGDCPPTCPAGTTYVDAIKSCVCPPGMTYNATTKQCALMAPLPASTSWLWWALGGAGVLFLLIASSKKKKHLTPAT